MRNCDEGPQEVDRERDKAMSKDLSATACLSRCTTSYSQATLSSVSATSCLLPAADFGWFVGRFRPRSGGTSHPWDEHEASKRRRPTPCMLLLWELHAHYPRWQNYY